MPNSDWGLLVPDAHPGVTVDMTHLEWISYDYAELRPHPDGGFYISHSYHRCRDCPHLDDDPLG